MFCANGIFIENAELSRSMSSSLAMTATVHDEKEIEKTRNFLKKRGSKFGK